MLDAAALLLAAAALLDAAALDAEAATLDADEARLAAEAAALEAATLDTDEATLEAEAAALEAIEAREFVVCDPMPAPPAPVATVDSAVTVVVTVFGNMVEDSRDAATVDGVPIAEPATETSWVVDPPPGKGTTTIAEPVLVAEEATIV